MPGKPKEAHRCLPFQMPPTFEAAIYVREREVRDRHLPVRDVVQVTVLALRSHGLGVVLDCLARLRAHEREAARAEEEENT
jgi:hypothetical protein